MTAFSIDDPMLALIARFAGCCNDMKVSEEDFLRRQCDQIRAYVESYPPDQRQQRALEWVTRNAEEYRRKWLRQVVTDEALLSRCADCPLERRARGETCEIHGRWLDLMKRYINGDITSDAYVNDTLDLLRRHKQSLRMSVLSAAGR